MNKYELYWRTFLIGIIYFNDVLNKMEYVVLENEIREAEEKTNEKIFSLAKIPQELGEPIPFFKLKIQNLENNNLNDLSYFTDNFRVKKIHS